MSIVLKELRETHINLKIINESELLLKKELIGDIVDECNQLVSIFYTSIKIAKSKQYKKP